MMRLSQVRDAVHGQMQGNDVHLTGVSTDSRKDCSGQLFIALRGDNFDAHDYLSQAREHGAVAVLVDKKTTNELPNVLVDNTLTALGSLAGWWRQQFEIPIIGVTGSVGKTSIKQMLASIFAQAGKGLVTQGNLNNEIGVPLTLLRMTAEDQYAVIEMGMNHAGEINRLTDMAKPTIALVSNAAAAHLQGLGSVEAVARAKGEIFQGLDESGLAVINLDDQYANDWIAAAGQCRVITFGINPAADVSAKHQLHQQSVDLQVTAFQHEFNISLALPGAHNVSNALAAIAAALAAEQSIENIIAGLTQCKPVSGRLEVLHFASLTLIDDTYNANPASMQAAIDVLANYPRTVLIVGDMGELGEYSVQAHRELGQFAYQKGIDQMLACGVFSKLAADEFGDKAIWFATQDELMAYLSDHPIHSKACLVKGSRAAKMERVVQHITESQAQTNKKEQRLC